jgi:hypothetical protein
MGQLRVVLVKRSNGGEVFAFARSLPAGLLGLLYVLPPFNQSSSVCQMPAYHE